MRNTIRFVPHLVVIVLLSCTTTGLSQCILSPFQTVSYASGECNELQFQQSIGQVFTGYGSCGGLSFTSPITETDQTVGTSNSLPEAFIRIYPNPFKELLFIEADEFAKADVRIYSIMGALIRQSIIRYDADFQLDLSTLSSGSYVIKIILDDTKCSTYTIIKS